ncbi:hypothetical protein B9Z55_013414 [Caenorhabditis nigoni]|uniref:Uncharacterized protein n=1 Tax=Caenorhabditis nigoni TaxID=1611254 RepID=A0A2G5U1L1_9PELO|nr:hypothetical protein B9Z55_013414 [Caenorhabditis nigoni]
MSCRVDTSRYSIDTSRHDKRVDTSRVDASRHDTRVDTTRVDTSRRESTQVDSVSTCVDTIFQIFFTCVDTTLCRHVTLPAHKPRVANGTLMMVEVESARKISTN